jgi:hypothetical protein
MLARLTRLGFSSEATPSELQSAREHFAQRDFLNLPGFVEPRLLRAIQRYLRDSGFRTREYADIGHDLTLGNNPVWAVLYFLMNDPRLFRLIRQVTGCRPIGCFTGRVYRMVEQSGAELGWHDDAVSGRKLVAISVNLSEARYRGGDLQIRAKSGRTCEIVANRDFGDAIIFRVARHLEHRVVPIKGKVPKTALTGWFRSYPKYTRLMPGNLNGSRESAPAGTTDRRLLTPSDGARIPGSVVSRTSARTTLIADLGTAMCYGLNRTGGRIWSLLAEGHSLRSLSTIVAAEHGASRRDVERDVLALAHKLAQRNLIKIVHAGARD